MYLIMEKFKIISKNMIANLPKTAGVYAFYEKKSAQPIYIGKAINLKSRVQNHFKQPSYRDNLFMNLVEKIGFINTGSEIEALILEASLIKAKQPKYNVVWKDDKGYFYVAIAYNKEKFPHVYITHQPQNSNFEFRISKINKFKYVGPFTEGAPLKNTLRVLRKIFPFYSAKTHPNKKCGYCHLNLCPGPNPDIKQYKKDIKNLTLILQGKKNTALNLLRKEMSLASKEQNFEQAGKVRDQIYNLKHVMSHNVLTNNAVPSRSIPGIDPKWENTQEKLAKILNLNNEISKIECYDISNIQGTLAVGSMVVFKNGVPDKSQYKKFRIQMNNTPNDIAMLKEVLQRRFLHPEWPYPQVILMDGGKAQLNAAINSKSQILNSKQIKNIKIIAIAKGRQELFIEGQENAIPLKDLPQEVYNLIKHLDDEAHRFAITYHKNLRKKYLLK